MVQDLMIEGKIILIGVLNAGPNYPVMMQYLHNFTICIKNTIL